MFEQRQSEIALAAGYIFARQSAFQTDMRKSGFRFSIWPTAISN